MNLAYYNRWKPPREKVSNETKNFLPKRPAMNGVFNTSVLINGPFFKFLNSYFVCFFTLELSRRNFRLEIRHCWIAIVPRQFWTRANSMQAIADQRPHLENKYTYVLIINFILFYQIRTTNFLFCLKNKTHFTLNWLI